MKVRALLFISLVVASVLSAAPDEVAGTDRNVKVMRLLHHGENETVELFCAAGTGICRLSRKRNGWVAAEVSLPSKSADSMLQSFLGLLPARPQRVVAGNREPLLYWDVRWLGRHVEGRLDREERRPDEPFVDAVLSLEGALLGQFYGRSR